MRENTSTEWVNKEVDSEGNFNRQKNQFETPFGEGEGKLPVEPGRYRLLWAPVCPWAHRSVIVRRLLGLEDVISLGTADPKRPDVPRSDWAFTLDEGDVDPVLGIHYISEAYLAANPDYTSAVRCIAPRRGQKAWKSTFLRQQAIPSRHIAVPN